MAVRRIQGRLKVQPLWVRVERNRVRLALFVGAFLLASALLAEAFVFVALASGALVFGVLLADHGVPFLGERLIATLGEPGAVAFWTAVCSVALTSAYVGYALTRPLRRQLASLGAAWVPVGELLETKGALKDMAIAAGVDPAPELFVYDSSSVNGFVIARGSQRPLCVVTRGLVERFSRDEQRAVFANLMARYRSGDVHWATAVSALMAPVWKWREWSISDGGDTVTGVAERMSEYVAGDPQGATLMSVRGRSAARDAAVLTVWALAVYMLAVIVSELVTLGHRRTHLASSVTADAEGMLLLKDPALMLATLDRAVRADNRIRLALPAYAGLFYVWAGDDAVDDDDPEWERLRRLREVVGVDGAADADREGTEIVREAIGEPLLAAPPAPRLEESQGAPPRALEEALSIERKVEPWPDRETPAWVVGSAAFCALGLAFSCLVVAALGTRQTALALLTALPLISAVVGVFSRRAWLIAAVVASNVGLALLAANGGIVRAISAVPLPASTVWGLAAAAAAAGAAGVAIGRLAWPHREKARR